MIRMSGWFTCLTLALIVVTPAAAGNWSLGTNMGFSLYNPDESDDITTFSFPGSVSLLGGFQPGLRWGWVGANPQNEFYLDTGLSYFSSGGTSLSGFEFAGNYQYNFRPQNGTAYLTGGLGFVHLGVDAGGGDNVSATSPIFGVGIGAQQPIANGHGKLRGEVRLSYVSEGTDEGSVIIDNGTVIEVKVGFDMWMK